ncbi:transposase-like zinc-binding domain-containing protein [Campylobacter sp.]
MWSFLIKKDGKNSSKNQRFKCKDCSKKFTLR